METGIHISTLLGIPLVLLPVLTVIVIFVRRSFKNEVSNLLMILCCLLFAENLFTLLVQFNASTLRYFHALFSTGEIIILFLLFRCVIAHNRFKHWMNYFLVAYVAAAVTLHITQIDPGYLFPLKITEAVMLVLLSLFTLSVLISNKYIFIFQSPLFWIAGGTWFYYSMVVLCEWLERNHYFSSEGNEKMILLGIFATLRFCMYLVAALIKGSDHYEEVWKNFKESSQEYLPPR